MKPFSKLKKQIDNLFASELEMQFCCRAYPMRSQRGSTSIPRFYVKMGKEIIFDAPKDFKIKEEGIYLWAGYNQISEMIRSYIDCPVDELINFRFKSNDLEFDFHELNNKFAEIFIASDRRLGKNKLLNWAADLENPTVNLILENRFSALHIKYRC